MIVVWVVEETWEGCIDAAARLLPGDEPVTLLYVVPSDVAELSAPGLWGRGRRAAPPAGGAGGTAQQLLGEAAERLGRPAATAVRTGRVEHEVVAASRDAAALVVARDGDRSRPGPRSLGPATRFVVDHASCPVLLVWP